MFAFFISCVGKDAGKKMKEVDVGQVTRGTIERKVLFTGNIEGQDAVEIYPKAFGVVSKKLLKEGDVVKKGQALFLVDRDEVGFTFKSMPVESPIDGVVGKIDVDVGTFIHERTVNSQKSVAMVVRPGNMRVKLDIPERYLDALAPGTSVRMVLDVLDGETFDGTITTKSPVVDEKTRTAKMEIAIPNPAGRLRHGMFGRLNLVVEKHDDVLGAPLNAISWEGAKRFVFKVDGDKLARTEVKTGIRNDVHVEILNGLSENDTIVVGNLLNLRDGEQVALKAKRE